MSLILYLAGLLALSTGLYFIRKSNEEQNAVIYLVFTAVLFMIIQAAEAAIINIIPIIRINAATFGMIHVIEGVVLWYFILAKGSRQKYFFKGADIAALIVVAIVVAIVAVRQFGIQFDNFNFRADSDAARHYIYARNVADQGNISGIFFSALNSGLIMNAFRGFINEFSFYRIFLFYQTCILFLNGAMFWVLIRRYLKDKFSIAVGIGGTLAYVLGYPWNSMVYGSAYLFTCIMCVTMTIFLLDMFYNDIFCSKKGTIFLLLISAFAVLSSYPLFILPVLGVILLLIILKHINIKSASEREMHTKFMTLITVCLIIGLALLYLWIVKGVFDDQVKVLSWWGCSYSTLYADFLFAVPFSILWFVKSAKSRTINVECTVLTVFFLYTLVLLIGNYFGKISAYYYYKMYSLLWIVAFMVIVLSIVSLKKERLVIFSYIITWGLLFVIYAGSVEKKLPQEYNLRLVDSSTGALASDYFGLYNCNIVQSGRDTINKTTKDLYKEAAMLSVQTKEFIPYIGEYKDHEWTYFALSGTTHVDVTAGKNYEAVVEELKKYSYILSVECEEPTVDVSKFLETLTVVYENEAGKIYRVDEMQTDESNMIADTEVDIILRYGFPKLERMGWVEQDEYVNSLKVIERIDKLGLDKKEFLYPERVSAKIEDTVSYLGTSCQGKETIVFDGTTSEELQHTINNNPNAIIDIHSKEIQLNDTIILKNNTAINGNGVILKGDRLKYGFIGENVADIYLNDISLEGKIGYGIYLIDCKDITISECKINRLMQKPICIIGDTKGLWLSGNEMSSNNAGGLYISGTVSYGLIEANEITGNMGTSKWMSGIVLTAIEPKNEHDIWEDFDKRHEYPLRDDVFGQATGVHDIIIRNNNISENRSMGIYSDGAYRCYTIGNDISRNIKGGVGLERGTIGFLLEQNFMDTSTDTTYPAVFMNNAAYNILRNNIITDTCVGIKLEHTAVRNLIMENVVRGIGNSMDQTYGIEVGTKYPPNKTKQIDYAPSYENIICRNSITGKHHSGIFIDEGCYVNDVFDNVIMESHIFAIEAVSDMFNSIINNTSNVEVKNKYDEN